MSRASRLTSLALAGVMTFSIVALPMAASASEQGKRNTALGLGAAAIALLLTQKNKLPGILVAAGAAYAYKQYSDQVAQRHRYERYYGYDGSSPYNNGGYYNGGSSGHYGSDGYNGGGYRYRQNGNFDRTAPRRR